MRNKNKSTCVIPNMVDMYSPLVGCFGEPLTTEHLKAKLSDAVILEDYEKAKIIINELIRGGNKQ